MIESIDTFLSDYNLTIFLIHLVAGFIMFVIINWIGEKSVSVGYMQMSIVVEEESYPAFNFLFKAIAPVIIMILFVAIAQAVHFGSFTVNCYLVVVYYWVIRVCVVILYGRGSLTNWVTQFFYWISSIWLSINIYKLIDKVDKILPDPESLRDEMWILIILFLYSTFNKMTFGRTGTIRRKEKYLNKTYTHLKSKYDKIISKECKDYFFVQVVYAIMIYEDFNRPKIVRWIEYVHFWITKKPHTLGIMQVTSSKWINDEESISLAINKIITDGETTIQEFAKNKERFSLEIIVAKIAGKYNKDDDYVYEVGQIFISISNKKKASTSFYQKYKHQKLKFDKNNKYYPFSFNNRYYHDKR